MEKEEIGISMCGHRIVVMQCIMNGKACRAFSFEKESADAKSEDIMFFSAADVKSHVRSEIKAMRIKYLMMNNIERECTEGRTLKENVDEMERMSTRISSINNIIVFP